MMYMRDPAEIEAEERAKAEEKKKKEMQKAAHFKNCRDIFGEYFEFRDVMWLSKVYFTEAHKCQAVTSPDQKAVSTLMSEGYPHQEVFISSAATYEIVKQWLGYRFAGRQKTPIVVKEELTSKTMQKCSFEDEAKDKWTFPDVVLFTYYYQSLYIDEDERAGFADEDVDNFQDLFDQHRGSHEELPPQKLWGMLEDINMVFETADEQKYVLTVLKEVDLNQNGTLCLWELLHLVRRLLDVSRVPIREREYKLLERSGMELEDIEGWHDVYSELTCETGSEWISMVDIKSVFEKISVKWAKEGTDKMKAWLVEVDDDYNGAIDFGEFVCLIQKMWEENFGGIRAIKPE